MDVIENRTLTMIGGSMFVSKQIAPSKHQNNVIGRLIIRSRTTRTGCKKLIGKKVVTAITTTKANEIQFIRQAELGGIISEVQADVV